MIWTARDIVIGTRVYCVRCLRLEAWLSKITNHTLLRLLRHRLLKMKSFLHNLAALDLVFHAAVVVHQTINVSFADELMEYLDFSQVFVP